MDGAQTACPLFTIAKGEKGQQKRHNGQDQQIFCSGNNMVHTPTNTCMATLAACTQQPKSTLRVRHSDVKTLEHFSRERGWLMNLLTPKTAATQKAINVWKDNWQVRAGQQSISKSQPRDRLMIMGASIDMDHERR